jgi:hypothetical protein
LGKKAAQLLYDDMERYFEVNKHIPNGYIGVLNGQFDKCLDPKDAPPLMAAAIELKVFCENVDKRCASMLASLEESLAEYQKIFDLPFLRDAFQKRIDKFSKELSERGLDALVDRTAELEVADANWRRLHPELSAKFPEKN